MPGGVGLRRSDPAERNRDDYLDFWFSDLGNVTTVLQRGGRGRGTAPAVLRARGTEEREQTSRLLGLKSSQELGLT